jgi:hypothetical protein
MFELDPSELELLAWAVPNEVLNGFKVENFQPTIGISEGEFGKRANRLRQAQEDIQTGLTLPEARAFRNALSLTVDELGIEEFHTRTGIDFEAGLQLLRKMDRFLGEEEESNA